MESTVRYSISSDVDDVSYRLKCAIQTLSAVHEAMESGNFDRAFYADALFGCYCHLYSLSDELSKLVDAAPVITKEVQA